MYLLYSSFFFNDTSTTEIYTLSLHDALPICRRLRGRGPAGGGALARPAVARRAHREGPALRRRDDRARLLHPHRPDRKSTRLNSSHSQISYAVFCLKKKNKKHNHNYKLYTKQ